MLKIVQKVLAPNAVYASSIIGNNAQKGYAHGINVHNEVNCSQEGR